MRARARLLDLENVSGTSTKTNKEYNFNVGQFLDLDTFDKLRLMVPDKVVKELSSLVGKDGVLDVGFDVKSEKLTFSNFKAAA